MPFRHLFRSDIWNTAEAPRAVRSQRRAARRASDGRPLCCGSSPRRAAAAPALTELVERSHLHKPTCRRILVGLMDAGLVEQDPASRRYFLGPEAYVLGASRRGPLRNSSPGAGMRRAACARGRRRGLRAGASRFLRRLPAAGGRRLPDSLLCARGRRPSSPRGRRRRPRDPRRAARRRGRGGARGKPRGAGATITRRCRARSSRTSSQKPEPAATA